MKQLNHTIFLMVALMMCSNHTIQAQMYRFVTTNQDGTVEVLYSDFENDVLEYSKNNSQNKIKLEVIDVQKTAGEAIYQVKFPNDNQVYIITNNIGGLTCENPDGTIQYFEPESMYVCNNPDGTNEYIFIPISLTNFIYSSSNNPNRIKLNIIGGDMMEGKFIVQFPNDTNDYTLIFSGDGTLTCQNPDGTTQLFVSEDY